MTQNGFSNDPWDSSMNPTVRSQEYWGMIEVSPWYAVLEKGQGKVPFDPQAHGIDRRVTVVDMKMLPIADQNVQFDVSRSPIVESREWAGITLPSIKAVGLSLRDLNQRYVRVTLKPTGETYTKDGRTFDRTAFELVKVFGSEAECQLDYQAEHSSNGSASAPATQPAIPPTNGNGADPGKATALAFLKPLVQNACRGQTDLKVIRDTIAVNLANMPLINKYFAVDSPEVIQLIFDCMSGKA